jgi:hypothetical protein
MDGILQIILSASWVLTDKHSASNEGIPVNYILDSPKEMGYHRYKVAESFGQE